MKKNSILPLLLASVALMGAAPAAVNVSGSLPYTQDFNGLPQAAALSAFNWTDDVTVTGFYLHRSNGNPSLAGSLTVATDRPFVASGSVAPNGTPPYHGFISLGPYNNAERALGFCPTTNDVAGIWAGGTLSIVAIFTNTGARPVDITDISYNIESYRASTSATTPETISLTYKLGTAAALLAELGTASASATFTQAGYNPVNGGSFDFTSANGFATNSSTERSGSLSSQIRIAPGQSIALRWGNANDPPTDAVVGIDDLFVNFLEVSAAVNPVVSNIVRNNNGTPAIPGDDTVDFTLNVAGLGAVGPGWKITSPASLSGITGSYGVPTPITGLAIAEFPVAAPHSIDVTVEDSVTPSLTASAPVLAPWGTITPVVTNAVRNIGNPAILTDDTWTYTVTVNGTYGSGSWISDSSSFPTGAYGTSHSPLTPLSVINSPSESIIFTDSVDSSITATVNIFAPNRFIGRKNFGVEELLMSDSSGVPTGWAVNETALTQKMDLGPGPPARVYRSEVLDLTSIGTVKFTGSVFVEDKTAGFEANDTFNAQLIIDGTTTVSLIAPYDTFVPADGVLTGAEISPATAGPPPTTGGGMWTHTFAAVIPASANSVQLVISGNNDSDNEEMTVQNLLFEIGEHSIIATPVGGVQFDNKGTVTADDDEYRQAVSILGVIPPPGSTGWTSNMTPAAGLYTDPQPVFFGPVLQSAPPQILTITDNNVPAVSTSLTLSSPTPSITAAFVSATIVGNADPTLIDNTTRLVYRMSAPVGSTEFRLDAHPLVTEFATYPLTATPTDVTILLTGSFNSSDVDFTFSDVGYPASKALGGIVLNTPIATTEYYIANKDFGTGVTKVKSLAGSVLPVEWQNFNNPPALRMTDGDVTAAGVKTVTGEVINLSAVGAVHFSATVHAHDISSGFEDPDTFLATLIIDGNTASPVNLITPHDTNLNGVLNGAELCPAPAVANDVQDKFYQLSADIPASANSVQLIITAINDSASETIHFENALFALASAGGDADSDGMTDAYEDANGLDKNNPGDKLTDLDGDGQSNFAEFLAGTAANSGASVFKATTVTKAGANASVTWTSVAGKVYRIDISPNMSTWTDVGTDFTAVGATTTATVPIPGGTPPGKYFLRVRVK